MSGPLHFLMVDDDVFVRQTVSIMLKRCFPDVTVHGAARIEEALEQIAKQRFDLILLDLALGKESGLSLIHQIRLTDTKTPVLVLSSQKGEEVAIPAFKAGANGFLCKDEAADPNQLRNAIQTMLEGQRFMNKALSDLLKAHPERLSEGEVELSAQEKRVLILIAQGRTVKEAAHMMEISEKTVRTYRGRLLEKLELSSDAELVKYAIKNGLIS